MSIKLLSISGLIFDMIGVTLVYFFGIQPKADSSRFKLLKYEEIKDLDINAIETLVNERSVEVNAEELKKHVLKTELYEVRHKIGYVFIIIGFVLFLIASILQ